MTNQEKTMNQLTANDVLKLVKDRAQWCRENGESDMRNIISTTRNIESMIKEGKTRDEILAAFFDDEDEDD